MLNGFRTLDRVLRGDATRPSALHRGTIELPLGGFTFVMLLLAMLYGVCMGTYALFMRWGTPRLHDGLLQIASSALKVPALFLLTLIVTCPSLYVFNALLGSRLTLGSTVRLLLASVGVLIAVLASFGTILVFFTLCTESYSFIILLNVALFSIAGGLGLGFLLKTLHRLANLPTPVEMIPATTPVDPTPTLPVAEGSASEMFSPEPVEVPQRRRDQQSVKGVFRVWVIVFGLVGAQMGWVLRPFVLAPGSNFVVFRKRESNFFQAVAQKVADLFNESTGAPKGGWRYK